TVQERRALRLLLEAHLEHADLPRRHAHPALLAEHLGVLLLDLGRCVLLVLVLRDLAVGEVLRRILDRALRELRAELIARGIETALDRRARVLDHRDRIRIRWRRLLATASDEQREDDRLHRLSPSVPSSSSGMRHLLSMSGTLCAALMHGTALSGCF